MKPRSLLQHLLHNGSASERGNVFAMLFAAVALTGVLASVGMQTLTGPVTSIIRVTQKNIADNNLLMDAKILVNAAVTGVSGGDADSDGIIEPAPFVPAGGGETPPTNGGFLPTTLGLSLTDPWGSKFGYCVWDHGSTNSSTNRILGDNTASAATQPVIAVIAAGPDKQFQTTCSAYAGGQVTAAKSSGSDDLVFKYTYAEATASSNGLWTLNTTNQAKAELKDSGGTARVSIDRATGIGDFLGVTTDTIAAKTGNITLDGGLKLDTDTNVTACAAGDAGVVRYNSAAGRMEVCNGSVWKPAGSADATFITQTPSADLASEQALSLLATGIMKVTTGTGVVSSGAVDLSGAEATGILAAARFPALTGDVTTSAGSLSTMVADDVLDFTEFKDAMTLDASTDIAVSGSDVLSITNTGTGNSFLVSDEASDATPFVIDANGNVGIGTTSPTTRLDVSGQVRTTGSTAGLLIARRDTSTNAWQWYSAAGNLSLYDQVNTVDRLTVLPNGNVGIGTALPAAKLDVAGGIKIGADAVCNASKAGMVAWNTTQLQICDGASFKNISAIARLDDVGDVYLSETGNPEPGNNEVLAWNATDSRWEAKNINTVGSAIATPGGSDKQVQFNDGGTLAGAAQLYWDKATNRLGIGTAFPGQTLQLGTAAIGTENYMTIGDANSQRLKLGYGHATGIVDNNFSAQLIVDGAGNLVFSSRTNNASGIQFYTNAGTDGVERMRIDSAGSVGIGTTTPDASSLLDVSSTTKGFLPPRMTTAQRDAIASPAAGLKVFNTDKGTTDVFTTAPGFGANHWELNGGNLRALGRGTSGSYNTITGDGPGGIWWMDGPGSTNGPTGTNTGTLIHLDPLYYSASTKNKYAIQLATNGNNTGKLYFREQYNGTWGGWVDLTAASGGGGTTLPNCADGETIVRQGGAWVCSDLPDVFAFTDLTGQAANTVVVSNILPVTGALQATVTITGTGSPQFRICSDASCTSVIRNWTSTATTINQGQHLQLRLTAAATTDGATRTATVQIGQISDAWSVSTQDNSPDAFAFTDVTNQPATTLITSNTLTITGIGPNPTNISVSGAGSPQISINGGAWTTSGAILPGQTLAVRLTSAGTSSTTRSATVTVGNGSDTWSVTTVPQDDTPNAFNFADVANQPASTVVASSTLTITGIGPDPVNVSIAGAGSPQISINGGAWATSGTILNGQTLQLRLTSHTVTDGTSRSATVTVGTGSDTWAVSTQDDTPAAFSFTDVTNQAVNALITSNTLTITGIGGNPTAVSVTGTGSPQISINGGAWTTSGTITAGQTLAVRLTSAGTSSTARSATVTVGNVSNQWDVTTIPQDSTPNAFDFTNLTNQLFSTLVTSNVVTITGIGPDPVTVSITGGGSPQFSIAGGAWTTSGTITNGQTLQLRMTTSPSSNTTLTATVTVGTVSDAWATTTQVQDNTPNAFAFTDVTGQQLAAVITSNTLTITGIGPAPVSVSVTGAGSPQVSINGGAWATSGSISNGQTLAVRLTSAGTSNTARTATVTVGTGSDTWSVTTATVTAGSQSFTTAGTHTFTVPHHETLTVQVWGAGGGGAGCSTYTSVQGGSGGQSSWDGAVFGNGGARASTTAGGAGGTASGGTTNQTGGTGGTNTSSGGGAAGGAGASGGSGGAARGSSGNGNGGSAPGGGGGGAYLVARGYCRSDGGGGGGYSTRAYSAGAYVQGSGVTVVVGGGGAGGNGSSYDGGAGAVGRVTITWN